MNFFSEAVICPECDAYYYAPCRDFKTDAPVAPHPKREALYALRKQERAQGYSTGPMFLVYRRSNGTLVTQPWGEITVSGGLIDEDTGDDLELVGWRRSPLPDAE